MEKYLMDEMISILGCGSASTKPRDTADEAKEESWSSTTADEDDGETKLPQAPPLTTIPLPAKRTRRPAVGVVVRKERKKRTTVGPRPFKCPHAPCEKAYMSMGALYTHQKCHDPNIRRPRCEGCHKTYCNIYACRLHEVKCPYLVQE